MRTICKTLYNFSELSTEAQQNAIENYRNEVVYSEGYRGGDEIISTIEKGLDHFGFTLNNYSIDWDYLGGSRFSIGGNDDAENLQGVRLWKYLHNKNLLQYFCSYHKKTRGLLDGNCPFTGVCFDEDFLDPLRQFVKRPNTSTTFAELMEECVNAAILAWVNDWEYSQTDECIKDEIEANEREFTEDGELA